MTSLDDLAAELERANSRTDYYEWYHAEYSRAVRRMPEDVARLHQWELDTAAEDHANARAARRGIEAQICTTREQATADARQIVVLAREDLCVEAIERRLVDLLGGSELPTDGLTQDEHAFVTAALRAREATLELEEAMVAFVTARRALLGDMWRAA